MPAPPTPAVGTNACCRDGGCVRGAERGKAPLLASGPLAGAAAASRLGARRWAGQGTVGLGGREVGKPKCAGFFFFVHTRRRRRPRPPHIPSPLQVGCCIFVDHTLTFQCCYSRTSCYIREQIRKHFRWVSAKRTVKRFSARLQLCYKGRRAVKMPRFQVFSIRLCCRCIPLKMSSCILQKNSFFSVRKYYSF
jgi:hypothetical protein